MSEDSFDSDSENTLKDKLLSLLRQHNFSPTHSLGQNFLIDPQIINTIMLNLELDHSTAIVEIGMGPAVLSRELALASAYYLGIEIDQKFKEIHDYIFQDLDLNLDIVYEDALKIDFAPYKNKLLQYDRLVVCSNLPYYITTELILLCINKFPSSDKMLFMLEKAALNRVLAAEKSKAYGPLSIISSLWGQWNKICNVPAAAFYPAPHTSSALYELTASNNERQKSITADPKFQNFTEKLLQNRRKTVSNALRYTDIASDVFHNETETRSKELLKYRLQLFLDEENLAKNTRAEDLTAEQFLKLFLFFYNNAV